MREIPGEKGKMCCVQDYQVDYAMQEDLSKRVYNSD